MELIDREDLINIIFQTEFDKSVSDTEFIFVLYKESKPLTTEELSNIIGCSRNTVRYHISELVRNGRVECCPPLVKDGDLSYTLVPCIREQLNEEFEILDKKNFGNSDNVTYLSGRIFAVVDRALTKQNGKGMTTKQFERACMYPFEVFGEILGFVLDDLDTDIEFSTLLSVLSARIGSNKDGRSKMPIRLNTEGRKLFKQGFEEMYTAMANDDIRRESTP